MTGTAGTHSLHSNPVTLSWQELPVHTAFTVTQLHRSALTVTPRTECLEFYKAFFRVLVSWINTFCCGDTFWCGVILLWLQPFCCGDRHFVVVSFCSLPTIYWLISLFLRPVTYLLIITYIFLMYLDCPCSYKHITTEIQRVATKILQQSN
jgi:hypothetical protein